MLIRSTKTKTEKQEKNYRKALKTYRADIKRAIQDGFRIVQVDEAMVTKRTFQTRAWSNKNQNLLLDIGLTDT